MQLQAVVFQEYFANLIFLQAVHHISLFAYYKDCSQKYSFLRNIARLLDKNANNHVTSTLRQYCCNAQAHVLSANEGLKQDALSKAFGG